LSELHTVKLSQDDRDKLSVMLEEFTTTYVQV